MPPVTFPVLPDGLLMNAMIGLDVGRCQDLQVIGQPIPRSVLVRGVLDTGADVTAVAPRVLQALGLSPSGSASTHTAGGLVFVNVYEISLSILHPISSSPFFTGSHLQVTELGHAAPSVEVLVGLDVLLQGVLTLDGPARTFALSF